MALALNISFFLYFCKSLHLLSNNSLFCQALVPGSMAYPFCNKIDDRKTTKDNGDCQKI